MSNMTVTFAQAYPFIVADLKANQTPALMGPAGIGKSSLINDLARHFKTKVFTLQINQLGSREDLTGVRMVQNEKTGSWSQKAFPHHTIMSAIEYAEEHPDEMPILFLDEFNRASSDITSAVLSLQTDRSIGNTKLPDNLRLIVAGNDKGNVTSLDEASISRFAMYYVKPDLDTFMSIQELNPYVRDVLTKHPDDLMAQTAVMNAEVSDDDDEDDNDDEQDAFSQYEFLEQDTFTQVTRPRTITYVSNWLDKFGLDKSGSDKEKELLGQLFTGMQNDQDNVLLAGIQAHVGSTTFAFNLFNEIQTHFNNLISATHVSTQPVLMKLRPPQDIVNTLSRAQSVPEIEALCDSMSDQERKNTLIWLTELQSTQEINNNQAVETFMKIAPDHIDAFDGTMIKNLMKVLTDTTRVSQVSVKALLQSGAPSISQWKAVITSTLETDN